MNTIQTLQKEIVYTDHLKTRIILREYNESLPLQIYEHSIERYIDSQTLHHIAVAEIMIRGEMRLITISYDDFPTHVEIVTIHPIKRNQINNRIKLRRWIKQ